MNEFIVIPIVIIPVAITLFLINATRGICYYSGNNATDNEKLIRVASEIPITAWPSKMHDIPYGRGQLREYWVLALKILMKCTRLQKSDHVNIILALISNAACAILVFYIGRYYFGDIAGLFVFSLYITSLWPYLVALGIGHILLSQAFFLMSVFALTLTSMSNYGALPLFLIAGILIGISFSSSPSSRKFPFMFLVAFLYQTKEYFSLPYSSQFDFNQLAEIWALATFGGMILLMAGSAIFSKPIGQQLIKLAEIRTGFKKTPERYTELMNSVPRQIRGFALWGVIFFALLYLIQPDTRFYINGLFSSMGIVVIAIHILAPRFIPNILRYRMFMDQTNWVSHFLPWKAHHQEIFGRSLPNNYRGGGIWWTPRFLVRVIPTIVISYALAFLILVGTTVFKINSSEFGMAYGIFVVISLTAVSLLPILVSEISKALQLGKAYFPAFLGLLVLIGAGASSIVELTGTNDWAVGLAILLSIGLVLGQLWITSRALISDVIPARMGPERLYQFLKNQHIHAFSTYDNPYNNSFAKTMLYSHPDEFAVTYIDTLAEADGAVVVIPPTSSKSVEMTSEKYSIENGDFRKDDVLVKLLDTEELEQISVAKLSTRGCSKYFIHESEVSTYRDIFLNQISDHDRWLGHGWVIDTKEIPMPNLKTNE